jgi:hypothetical protein
VYIKGNPATVINGIGSFLKKEKLKGASRKDAKLAKKNKNHPG